MVRTKDKRFNDAVNTFLEHSKNNDFPRYPTPLEQIRGMAKYLVDNNYISTRVANSKIIRPANAEFGGLNGLKGGQNDYGTFVNDVIKPIAEKKMGVDENYSFTSRGVGNTSTSRT